MSIIFNNTFLLRLAVSIILVAHGVGGMFNGGINGFGQALNDWGIGLAPLGVPIAWAIKLSHLVCVFSLLSDKYVKIASLITIFILTMGIILIHGGEGWFVVGGGRNGMEFNFLLIFALLTIMFPNGIKKTTFDQV
jgi:putative oxidoreductase